jgi:hypothetical protein
MERMNRLLQVSLENKKVNCYLYRIHVALQFCKRNEKYIYTYVLQTFSHLAINVPRIHLAINET